MKVNPQTLMKIFEVSTIKYQIDPVKLLFRDDGVYVRQTDSANVMASVVWVGTNAFKDYEPIGEVPLELEYVKRIKNMFKIDDYIDFDVSEGKVNLKGSRETYSLPLTTLEINTISSDSFQQTEYGFIIKKSKIHKAMKVDLTELDVDYDEVITLDYSFDDLVVEVPIGDTLYTKTIPSKSKEFQKVENAKVSFDGKLLSSMVEMIKDSAWLVFTDGPLHILYSNETIPITVTYILAQRVTT
jgi:hypothetical protein